MKKWIAIGSLALAACQTPTKEQSNNSSPEASGKIVIYQAFTRLWGNTNTTNRPWGTMAENGVGKFADFTDAALDSLKALGITHIWYTGVPHHALINDYSSIGISADDPDVVKGRAGSPYAVKDYYNVNPDLATDPAKRLEEFKALVERTHKHGLKVIIDIVPNHVARHYRSLSKPDSVSDFGADDDKTVEYKRDNNFYYIPGKAFAVPKPENNYKPLGGEAHPMSDGKFDENPAKWTGNGSRLAQPNFGDWYETVKINYGIRPDGTKDFDTLPASFATQALDAHYAFWQGKSVPSSWKKFRDIALFWLDLGVDGFRFDMAEMVPVEFWSYMNSAIKHRNPTATLVAEVYNPKEYRNYIRLGKMDYLYDKVELYDTLKHIIQGTGSTDNLTAIFDRLADIAPNMLHFLENHDEQRIASPAFAGDPWKAMPAMVLSATVSTSPTLIYYGQEVGEPGAQVAGFGQPTRTSIFDYMGVPHHQRWLNNGKYDGGQLSPAEKALRHYYRRLLNYTLRDKAMAGSFASLHEYNRQKQAATTQLAGSGAGFYSDKLYAFARWQDGRRVVVVCNFSPTEGYTGPLYLPKDIISQWKLADGSYGLMEELFDQLSLSMTVKDGEGMIPLTLKPLESVVLSVQ